MDRKLKHLQFIQDTIMRLSTNSFLLKGWGVVLISALFVLSRENSDRTFVLLAFFPLLVFWVLDGYFLWQEHLYRNLYDSVRKKEPNEIDFSMDTSGLLDGIAGWLRAASSPTIIAFHGVLLIAIIVVLSVL